MTISSVYNSFRWLVAPLVCLLLVCQVLALCIVLVTPSSLHTPSGSPVDFHAHDHVETQQAPGYGSGKDAKSGQYYALVSSNSVLASMDQSSPHFAEHDCCDNNEDALRTAVLMVFAFGIVLILIRIVGALNYRFSGAANRNSRPTEYGYPRPHLVFCRLLN